MNQNSNENIQTATLGGGCFWCTEAVYQDLKGVKSVVSGYAGGHVDNPTYEQICTKTTGHAEVVQIEFDAGETSYEEILNVFWKTHDPTTLNQQGNDRGPQYRSVIFYHDDTQKSIAEKSLEAAEAAELWPDPIVTEIAPLTRFYKAEDNHQNFYKDNSNYPYCVYVINPKVQKFKKEFSDRIKGI